MTMNTTTMHAEISEAFSDFKAIRTSRRHRMDFAEELAERYFAEYGKMPDGSVLDRLATLILQDELADKTPWKTRNTEYPIESPRQELDYYNGLTSKQIPDSIGVDGVDYKLPTRRVKTPRENAHIDRELGRKRKNGAKGSEKEQLRRLI